MKTFYTPVLHIHLYIAIGLDFLLLLFVVGQFPQVVNGVYLVSLLCSNPSVGNDKSVKEYNFCDYTIAR